VTALCLAPWQPTALAADESHLYVTQLIGHDDDDTGRLLRLGLDGQEPCVVASGLEYESGTAVDDQFVYWVAGRQLHKLPKR